MAGVNMGYTMVPNPVDGGRDVVKCLLCQAGEDNPTFVQLSVFARHCDTQHPDWETYAASGFVKCNVCDKLYRGQAGISKGRSIFISLMTFFSRSIAKLIFVYGK